MSKIAAVKKIIVEDFPATSREVVQRLATVLNPFLDQVGTALTSNLSFKDNVKCRVYSVDIAATAAAAAQSVAWDLNEKPTSVVVGRLAQTSGVAPTAAFSLSWRYENAKIYLTFIGLDAATTYSATIIGQV